jgi:hypothetical protein
MSISRYTYSKRIKTNRAKSSADTFRIYQAIESGNLSYRKIILEQQQRLDHLAGITYNDASLWWIIAAASGIGWGLQVPAGTVIRIPINPGEALGYLG